MSGLLVTATTIGLMVMACVLVAVVLLALVAIARWWPVRVTYLTAAQRHKHDLAVARLDWRTNSGGFNPMNALVGLSSRGKSRWFFGLMLLGEYGHDRDLQWPRIITRKATPANSVGTQDRNAGRSETQSNDGAE